MLNPFPPSGMPCARPRVRPCSVRPPRAKGGSPVVARWLPGTVGDRRRWASVDFTTFSYQCAHCDAHRAWPMAWCLSAL